MDVRGVAQKVSDDPCTKYYFLALVGIINSTAQLIDGSTDLYKVGLTLCDN